jgi:hypothetical protein
MKLFKLFTDFWQTVRPRVIIIKTGTVLICGHILNGLHGDVCELDSIFDFIFIPVNRGIENQFNSYKSQLQSQRKTNQTNK